MDRQVARFGLERQGGQLALLAPRDPVLLITVRAGEQDELTVLGVGMVELDAGLDERTHDGMPPEAVVDVPAEIAVALNDVRVLDEDHRAVETVVAYPQVRAGESRETQQTG